MLRLLQFILAYDNDSWTIVITAAVAAVILVVVVVGGGGGGGGGGTMMVSQSVSQSVNSADCE